MSDYRYDGVVVGSGPNGLAAAVTLARAGKKVLVMEAADVAGGGMRTEELTLPGFKHDLFSGVHPMAVASPFFRSLALENHGVEWIVPPAALAHTMGDTAAFLENSVAETAAKLGSDGWRYRRVFGQLTRDWEALFEEAMKPPLHFPRHPILMARFGTLAMLSAKSFATSLFNDPKSRALIAGCAAHANVPLDRSGTTSIAIMLMVAAHAIGWPIPKGGAGSIASALIRLLRDHKGEIETGREVRTLSDLPPTKQVFFDLSPRSIKEIFERSGEKALAKSVEVRSSGPGLFKIDWALSGPIPWLVSDVSRAATVHVGGALEHIAHVEERPIRGESSKRPFVILSQPTLFDPSRAPNGRHVAWAYCHVPANSTTDMTDAIEEEIERYAPGFRSLVLARCKANSRDLETKNANLVGGSIGGGEFRFWRMLRPSTQSPYVISKDRGFFICSSWAPPGPGVHGMCGFNAANVAIRLGDD